MLQWHRRALEVRLQGHRRGGTKDAPPFCGTDSQHPHPIDAPKLLSGDGKASVVHCV
jgi:hypothetical protein